MVGIVIVSHSDVLAEGVVRLAREMTGDALVLVAAGGMDEPGVLGTDAERVRTGIETAMSPDGVLVLMDLGSALMSAELAVDLLGETAGPVMLSEAPLVEGAVAAAVSAAGGATLAEVAAEARGALAMKAAQLGAGPPPADADAEAVGAPSDHSVELQVANAIGLHARPAARFVSTARQYDAEVNVAKAPDGTPVRATSLTNVVALGARPGDTLVVTASGPQAQAALEALRALADEGFGDGLAAPGTTAGTPAPTTTRPVAAPAPAAPTVAPPQPGEVLTGVPAAAGVVHGAAHHLHSGLTEPPEAPSAVGADAERGRLGEAISGAREAIVRDRETLAARAGRGEAAILDAHLELLGDEAMLEPAHAAIAGGSTAERAWYEAARGVADIYRGLEEPLLQERAIDVLDVGRRVLTVLGGGPASAGSGGPQVAGIVIAGELTPADAAALDPARVLGIATAHGTATAHAAILARALGLPAVVGLGERVMEIGDGTELLLDGEAGTVQVQPPAAVAQEAQERRRRATELARVARERAHETGATRDGTRIEVFANLGATAEAARAVELGAEGVGLLRTEFLFLDRAQLPDEDEQTQTLLDIARALDGRPLIVRTLDAGADKPLPALPMPPEANPFLGVRGIRLALARPEILETQFRAILRVAAEHPLRAMLPMIATAHEIVAARAVLGRAREATGSDAPLELGIMVEIPAAAICAAELAQHADFFSIGTNDLSQYTMAAERGDERLAGLLTGPQPAVLRLIAATVTGAATRGRTVGVCGELAGDPAAALLLAGLGVTELSMAPALIPEAKAALRSVDMATLQRVASEALNAADAAAARALATALR